MTTSTIDRPRRPPKVRRSYRMPCDLVAILEDEAERRGISEVELVRSTLAASLFTIRHRPGAR